MKHKRLNYKRDLPGKRFGKLTVLRFNHVKQYQNYFLCICDCGVEKIIMGGHLTRRKIVSCVCLYPSRVKRSNRFGKLTVQYLSHKIHRHGWIDYYYQCRCACGNEIIINGRNLKSGNSTQCKSCARISTKLGIGKNESKLLDLEEKKRGIKIQRQKQFLTYLVDGYHAETNTIFEVFERHHDKQLRKDYKRLNELDKLLGCEFVIIHDRFR